MTDTTSLLSPISADLDAVERCLVESADGQHPLLADALRYVFDTRGKRLRPALVLLSGALGTYELDQLVTLAASLEVVHTASLVHDDTIDDAMKRRGLATVNSVWDKHTAIVTGDFLFAKSAELAARIDSVRIMHMLSQTVMEMCAGEMRQYAARGDWNISIDEYLKRIGAKTASLFAMCCAGAAVASGQSEAHVDALYAYGYNFGVAFQIVDDILDFESEEHTLGKPAGNDLAHGTITLPAILFMQKLAADAPLRQRLQHGEDSQMATELIKDSGVVEEARAFATRAAADAESQLDSHKPSEARDSLVELARQLPRRRR
jgi:geranylgeranyl pyrophosphate synthase